MVTTAYTVHEHATTTDREIYGVKILPITLSNNSLYFSYITIRTLIIGFKASATKHENVNIKIYMRNISDAL